MGLLEILAVVGVAIVALIPIERMLVGMGYALSPIQSPSKPTFLPITMSKVPYYYALAQALAVARGALAMWVGQIYVDNSLALFLCLILLLAGVLWSPLNRLRPQPWPVLPVVGVFIIANWPSAILIALSFPLLALLFEHFGFALLAAVLANFALLWFQNADPILLPVNFVVFLAVMLAELRQIARALDGRKRGLLAVFKARRSAPRYRS